VKQRGLQAADGVQFDAVLHEPHGRAICVVLQLHGIAVDMDEGGMFVRLADGLAVAGFSVLRLSFRGHGRSSGTDRGMTIAGEMLDLQAALDHAGQHLVVPSASGASPLPLSVVAASFGAVPLLLSLPLYRRLPRNVVLWNPVLDLARTFVRPELSWGRASFGAQADLLKLAFNDYFLSIDGLLKDGSITIPCSLFYC